MFKIPIMGEINGKSIKIFIGNRYKFTTDKGILEGTLAKCNDMQFLLKTINGGFWIDFETINDIESII